MQVNLNPEIPYDEKILPNAAEDPIIRITEMGAADAAGDLKPGGIRLKIFSCILPPPPPPNPY